MKTKEIIVTVHRVEPVERFGFKDVLEVLGSLACLAVFVISLYVILY